jgi:Uma2 family endonuclease
MPDAMARDATRLDRRLRACDLDDLPHAWDTRYELIGGVLFMSTRPSMEHQRTIARVIVALHPPVTAAGGIVVPEPGLVWDDEGDDNVSPDVAVVLADRLAIVATRLRGAPNLVVEVLSPAPETRRRDLEAKRALYFRRGASEYWIIDPDARMLLRLTRGDADWIEERVGEDGVVRTPLLPDWAGVSVADLLAPR